MLFLFIVDKNNITYNCALKNLLVVRRPHADGEGNGEHDGEKRVVEKEMDVNGYIHDQ